MYFTTIGTCTCARQNGKSIKRNKQRNNGLRTPLGSYAVLVSKAGMYFTTIGKEKYPEKQTENQTEIFPDNKRENGNLSRQ
jgi:hypothetical protein